MLPPITQSAKLGLGLSVDRNISKASDANYNSEFFPTLEDNSSLGLTGLKQKLKWREERS
jgi:hypothetical protein